MNSVRRPLPETVMTVHSRGFTLFELILAIIVVALAAGVLFGRVLFYQEMAEKTAMEQTVGGLRSALTIQLSGLMARGRMEEIPKLESVNPMVLLTRLPENYVGEYYGTPSDVSAGNWYFDLKSRELVYLVRHGMHFQSAEKGGKTMRYRISLVYNDWLQTAGGMQAGKEPGGITLQEVQPYTWAVK